MRHTNTSKTNTLHSCHKLSYLNFHVFCVYRQLKREESAAQAAADLNSGPKLDLSFKAGQTIKININVSEKHEVSLLDLE